ncbi:hypothetical protein U3516DRAFT_662115 [Neocallimastix sp. 'constans']
MNNKLLFLIELIFSINGINGIKMTEKEILNLNLTQYNNANVKCPEFGFTFYCIDDNNCQSDNYNSTFLEFIDNNGNIRKYMKNDENCTEDSDCLSNKCLLNTCKPGNNSSFTECSDNYIYTSDSDDSQQGYQKIKCRKINGSQCNGRNQVDECAGHCNNLSYCESHHKRHDYIITIETTNKTSSTTLIEKSTSTNLQPKYFVLIGYGLYKYQITPEYKTIFERKVRKLRNLNDMKRTITNNKISISRNNLLNDAFDSIMNLSIIELKRTLRISYIGEEGTDAGGINEINVNDWKDNTVYEGYTLYDPTITYFWMFVNELSKEEKSLLLIFATGTSQIPATGFKDLQGNGEIECFKIKRVGNEKDLPVSHTCFNRIDLPPYSSYTMLKQKMMKATTEGITGFQLS